MIETIEKYLALPDDKPFLSSIFFEWLGYSRHSDFKRALNKPELYPELVWSDLGDHSIRDRRREVIFISKSLFKKMAIAKHPELREEIENLYIKYMSIQLRAKIIHFYDSGKKKEFRWHVCRNIAGKFYTYRLRTDCIAKDLGLCPYELFKFCSTKFSPRYEVGRASCTYDAQPLPYQDFDSIEHTRRYLVLAFLKLVKKEFKMDGFTAKLLEIYTSLIEELIFVQADLDVKAGRIKGGKQKSRTIKKPTITPEMTALYKALAKRCHPDVHQDEFVKTKMHLVFIKLKSAYDNADIGLMEEIRKELTP